MRRIPIVLVLTTFVWSFTGGVATASSTANTATVTRVQADFNNDGFADLAIGVPFEDVGDSFDAGAVNVLYGSAEKLTGVGSQMFSQNSPGVRGVAEDDDRFGSALATGDFNRDGFADLAIGVPAENIGSVLDGGAVNVLYGSAGKLMGAGSQMFSQNSSGVRGSSETTDGFGFELAAGDFDNDGSDDLAVGVPFEAVGDVLGGGAVNVLYSSAGKLTGVGSQMFSQNSPGVGGTVEEGDGFGFALVSGDFGKDKSDDLAIGVSSEDVGGVRDAGAVNMLYGSAGRLTGAGSQMVSQNSSGVSGAAEEGEGFGVELAAGDFDNNGSDDLAVGVPFETVGDINGGGAVNVLYGLAGKLAGDGSQMFTQQTAGVVGDAQAGDMFGWALAVGNFNHDAYADLAVGVPDDSVGAVRPAGAVNVLYGSAGKLTGEGSQRFSQDSPGVGGMAEPDSFGAVLTVADFNNDGNGDLAVGVPSEAVGDILVAGAVNVLYGSAGKLTGVGSQIFTQSTPGVGGTPEAVDQFGQALASSGPQT